MTWPNESERHRLSALGVETSYMKKFHKDKSKIPPRDLYPFDVEYDRGMDDREKEEKVVKIIYAFWWASETNNWNYFPMNDILNFLYYYMDDYISHWDFRHERVLEEEKVDEFLEISEDMHKTFYKIEEMVENTEDFSKSEKINMIDEIIHTYHYSGGVFNIPKLRKNFKSYYGRYL